MEIWIEISKLLEIFSVAQQGQRNSQQFYNVFELQGSMVSNRNYIEFLSGRKARISLLI